jgi:NACalpha-BTF3-like transcription factor
MPNYSNNANYQPFSSHPAQQHQQHQQHPHQHSPMSPPVNLRGVSANSSIPSSTSSPSIFRAGGNSMPPLGRPDPYHHPSSLIMNQETSYSGSMYDSGPNMTTFSMNSQHSNGMNHQQQQQQQHQHHQHQQQPMFDIRAMNQQVAIRPNDMHGMDRSMLMMQQEAEFGINMFDSLTPADEPEMNALIAQGYSNDEAVKLIFDRRYRPYDPRLGAPLNAIGGMSSLPPAYYPPPSSMPMSYPPPQGHYPNSYPASNDNHSLQYSNDSYYEDRRRSGSHSDKRDSRGSGGGSKKKLVKGGSVSKSRSGDHQPQKVKSSDVKQLEKMGFSKQQAVQALLENNNDLHRAADVLLSRR